jgi:inner membrane protein
MDSLSQAALGAAVAVAVMQRRTAVWKAAAWGAVGGTLPDLDVLVDHGDPILNMVLHRAETHALFWLSLFSLPFAWAVATLHTEWGLWKRWWLALWLVLITHPLLDGMTVYGTQLLLPFTDRPFGVGSLFIIDPLYTLPLLVGVVLALALRSRPERGLRANHWGLALSTAYIGWSVLAQQQVQTVARATLQAQGIPAERVLVTPSAFNTVLWRVVAVGGGAYHEGFYSLFDTGPRIDFRRVDRGDALLPEVQHIDGVQRIQAFSKGFYALRVDQERVRITDLRMGQYPTFIFAFHAAQRQAGGVAQALVPAVRVGQRPDPAVGLPWLWRRMWGERLPSPG